MGVRLTKPRKPGKHKRTADPSAREWFSTLKPIKDASRPVIGRTPTGRPIFGAPTYRNTIEEYLKVGGKA